MLGTELKRVLQVDGGDVCTTATHFMPLTVYFKVTSHGEFCYLPFTTIKKQRVGGDGGGEEKYWLIESTKVCLAGKG